MISFLKRFWYLFVVFVCLGGVGILISMPLISEVSACKQTLADAESKYNQFNAEETVWYYQAFKDDCASNKKLDRWLEYDLAEIDNRVLEADLFRRAEMLVSVFNYAGSVAALDDYLQSFPEGGFRDRANELLAKAKAKKEQAFQKYYKAGDWVKGELQMVYFNTCQYREIVDDAHQAIIESTMPARIWFPAIDEFPVTLGAKVIAEFKIAACFEEVNPMRIEKCDYSRTGIRGMGVERTLERMTSEHRLVLKDVRNGATISEYPELIQSNPPKPCPEKLVIDDTMSPLPTIIYFGTPDINSEILVWIEEQVGQME